VALPRFVPYPGAIEKITALSGVELAMKNRGEILLNEAREVWMSTSHPYATGDYADSFEVESRGKGVGVRVIARDYKAVWLEFGTGDPGPTPAFSPFRRAVDRLGWRRTRSRGVVPSTGIEA